MSRLKVHCFEFVELSNLVFIGQHLAHLEPSLMVALLQERSVIEKRLCQRPDSNTVLRFYAVNGWRFCSLKVKRIALSQRLVLPTRTQSTARHPTVARIFSCRCCRVRTFISLQSTTHATRCTLRSRRQHSVRAVSPIHVVSCAHASMLLSANVLVNALRRHLAAAHNVRQLSTCPHVSTFARRRRHGCRQHRC